MKKLLLIALLFPLWAQAQVNTVLQKTAATGTVRSYSVGPAGTDTLAAVRLTGVIAGDLFAWSATLKKLIPLTIVPIANGGTGSATKNFVDLTTTQTVGGAKTFSKDIVISGATGAQQFQVNLQNSQAGGLTLANASGTGHWTVETDASSVGAQGNFRIRNQIFGSGSTPLTISTTNNITAVGTVTAPTFIGALTGNASTVTTNANLTGVITSVGNATSIASQTGTGTTFAMSASPTFTGTLSGALGEFTGAVNLATSSGDVGIGTASPLSRLHVRTGTNQNVRFRPGTDVGAANGVAINSRTDDDSALQQISFRATDAVFLLSGSATFNAPISGTSATFSSTIQTTNGAGNYVAMGGAGSGASFLTSFESIFNIGNVFSGGTTNLFAGNVSRYSISSGGNHDFKTGTATFGGVLSGTSATFSSTISASNLTSGTYTPTLTNVTNVTSSTAYSIHYSRIGNEVTVSGKVDVTPTTTGTATVGISLPIASNFTATTNAAGSGGTGDAGSIVDTGIISGDVTNDRANLKFYVNSTFSVTIGFTFMYTVL